MTVLAGVTTRGGRSIVLAADSSAVAPQGFTIPDTHVDRARQKLFPLSSRLPIAAVCGGTLARFTGPEPVRCFAVCDVAAQCRATNDETGEAVKVEDAGRQLAAAIFAAFGPYWRAEDEAHCAFGYVGGFDAGAPGPRLYAFTILPGAGVTTFRAMPVKPPGLLFVSPLADAAGVAARAVTRLPCNPEDGVALLRRIIGRQIEHAVKFPSGTLAADGPVDALTLTPGSPPRFVGPAPSLAAV